MKRSLSGGSVTRSTVMSLVVLIIAAVAAAGWIIGELSIAGLSDAAIPMAPTTIFCFFLLSGATLALARMSADPRPGAALLSAAAIPAILGAAAVVPILGGPDLLASLEGVLAAGTPDKAGIPLGRMSPLTGVLFLASSAAIICTALGLKSGLQARTLSALRASAALAVTVVIVSLALIMGYAYGAPFLYDTSFVPPALPTAIAFLLASGAIAYLTMPRLPLALTWGRGTLRWQLLSVFLPSTLAIVVVLTLSDRAHESTNMQSELMFDFISMLAAVGAIVFVTAIATNRSAGRIIRAEEELRKSHQLLEQMEREASIGAWALDVDSNSLTWSSEVRRIHAVAPDFEPEVAKAIDFYDQESRPIISQAVEAAIATGSGFDLELGITTAKGDRKIVHAIGAPIKDDDGRVTSIHGVFQDITERRRTQDQIEAERERLRVTLRSIGDGVIVISTDGSVELMNPVAEELTGWTLHEAVGRPFTDVFHIINEATREPQPNPVDDVMASGMVVELANHTVLIAKDGQERVIADSAAPIRDSKSVISGVVLVFRDETEARRIEREMAASQKLESLGVLAGGIAHDFNNLIGGFYGFLELAEGASTEPEVRKHLDKAKSGLERARGLTRQLLTFAKGGEPIRQIGPVAPLVEETVIFALSGSNIRATFDMPSDLRFASFDRAQIGQVIENIAINATQAMGEGGVLAVGGKNVRIDDKRVHELDPGEYLAFTFQDHGKGITPEILSCIFDPFFSTKEGGQGLGLATCRSIVNRHEGAITVESVPDMGTTFTIYLPATDSSGYTETAKPGARFAASGLILVMDDEEIMRESMSLSLASLGFEAVGVKDGRSALEFLERARVDGTEVLAAFMDLTIPGGMGGLQAIRELRESDPHLPVFVASGYSDDPVMADPTAYGFTASICKPFIREELTALISGHLSASKDEREVAGDVSA